MTQDAAAAVCSYSLTPTSHNATAAGGSSTFDVNTTSGCNWTSSDVPAWVTGIPANGTGTTTINFTVVANPDPTSRSANITIAGQTFAVTQDAAAAACIYSLNPTSRNPTAAGGPSSVEVTTTAGCSWTSSGVPAWITPWGPANGMGTTTINFTVTANPDPAPRTANITIGGQPFTVTQDAAAAACIYSLNPTSRNPMAAGGPSSVEVTTTAGCSWTSSGVPAWITQWGPANGMGTTTINFTVTANPDPAPRTANITIGGQPFTVTQDAAAAACIYSLNPTSRNPMAAGGPSSVEVTTTAGCSWTSSGVPAWITQWGPANGMGTTTINFTVTANPDPAPRTANITIGGQPFTVTQAAACSYSLNPTSHNASVAGGSSSFDVNTTAGCNWTSSGVPAWITGVPGTGTSTTTINFTVAANTGPARDANIVIGSQTFAVSQARCTYAVAPGSLTFSAAGTPPQDITLTTQASCNWTATSSDSWIVIVSGGSGPGNGTIRIELQVHTGTTARTGTLSVGGETVTITQNP